MSMGRKNTVDLGGSKVWGVGVIILVGGQGGSPWKDDIWDKTFCRKWSEETNSIDI